MMLRPIWGAQSDGGHKASVSWTLDRPLNDVFQTGDFPLWGLDGTIDY